jgi:drug/metabolite transporter (DMT)-like permease
VLLTLSLAVISGSVVLGVARPGDVLGLVRVALWAQALLALGASVYLALYVAGEDDYRSNGTTRWDAYDAKGLTLTAIAMGLAVTMLALALVAWPRKRFLPALGLAGIVAAALIFVAFFANTLN